MTSKANKTVSDFNSFTDNKFISFQKTNIFVNQELDSYFLVTRIPYKLKPNKNGLEEMIVSELKKEHNVILLYKLKGYNIYKIVSN